MSQPEQAVFSLVNYRIVKFSFDNTKSFNTEKVSVNFDPSGVFIEKNKEYFLRIVFNAFEKDSTDEFFTAEMDALFEFGNINSFDEMPEYFYANSLAMVYPYLRAFISTITLQANLKNLILPTLNLSSLESVLKEATEVQ